VSIHFVVPTGFGDRPSGGNIYDRRLLAGLAGLGWDVATHEVEGPDDLAGVLPALPDGAVALVDGLVGSACAGVLLDEAARLRLVLLVHMPFETPRESELLGSSAAVVTTSNWTRRWLVEHYGLAADQLHVAVPGVDVADPAPGTEAGGELLCVASVTAAKGHDLLLAALATLTDLDWRCTLVGALDLEPDFVDELRKAAADTGIADRVDLAGPLDDAGVRAAYAGADLLVLASHAETYGMVVTEALAHGLPVVATAVGGVPEALGHAADGSTPGLLVRSGDPQALAAALRQWVGDPHCRQRLRHSAGLRRLTLPTWSQTTAQIASVLEAQP
jgi:glycosyltransferase involved in cell wall biosynthesis